MSESIDLENIHLAKIGVILDMDNGLICFLNPDSNNDIVSYPRKNAKTSKTITKWTFAPAKKTNSIFE